MFLNGEEGHVRKFLHKQTVETLIEMGAVNENNCVDIDTGAVIFSPEILDQLYSLINIQAKYEKYVNNTVTPLIIWRLFVSSCRRSYTRMRF